MTKNDDDDDDDDNDDDDDDDDDDLSTRSKETKMVDVFFRKQMQIDGEFEDKWIIQFERQQL